MPYLRHPPLFAGVFLLLVLVGLYFVGANPSAPDTTLYYEKIYAQDAFRLVHTIEQYGDGLATWCAQNMVDNKVQLDSFVKTSSYSPLWTRYYDALGNCATSDDYIRSSAFLIESIYSLAAAYK